MGCGNRHTHAGSKTLPKWTSGSLDAGSQTMLGMTRRFAVELPEILDLFHWEIITREVEQ
jgi:hypothetical protein